MNLSQEKNSPIIGCSLRYLCGVKLSNEGLSDSRCSGLCLPGYYCESASTSNKQYPCGNETVHCPMGSSSPILTEKGKYSYNSSLDEDPKSIISTMSWQKQCEEGYYCIGGKRFQCPEGTFSNATGMSSVDDCKPCRQGTNKNKCAVSHFFLPFVYLLIFLLHSWTRLLLS